MPYNASSSSCAHPASLCVNCGRVTDKVFIRAEAELVCGECGLVLDSRMMDDDAERLTSFERTPDGERADNTTYREVMPDSGHTRTGIGAPAHGAAGGSGMHRALQRASARAAGADACRRAALADTLANITGVLNGIGKHAFCDRACGVFRTLLDAQQSTINSNVKSNVKSTVKSTVKIKISKAQNAYHRPVFDPAAQVACIMHVLKINEDQVLAMYFPAGAPSPSARTRINAFRATLQSVDPQPEDVGNDLAKEFASVMNHIVDKLFQAGQDRCKKIDPATRRRIQCAAGKVCRDQDIVDVMGGRKPEHLAAAVIILVIEMEELQDAVAIEWDIRGQPCRANKTVRGHIETMRGILRARGA
jgi:hypothetical protein